MDKCLICGREIKVALDLKWLFSLQPFKEPVICHNCEKNFKAISDKQTCPGCGRLQDDQLPCKDCQRWSKMGEAALLGNQALYVYNEAMKSYMQRYKFNGDYQWRLIFQDKFSQFVTKSYCKNVLYVLIPVDQITYKTRGFNQVAGLLQNVKVSNLLAFKTTKAHIKQSTKTRQARMETAQPFKYCGKKRLTGQKVILIDDIYTTGRTLYHAKHVLQQNGASQVRSLTLAR
ncbi:ComF family protein [Ligilactobacillus acidipiscis]|jgi:competence protein ComFC|uniref:ComF family protein n=1 Tax=Ligilactobacillus acidipiscis TaxID=89059 RepID=UPI002FD8C115|nr:ComF family protein [Ligilactobacillus acidipiscis]